MAAKRLQVVPTMDDFAGLWILTDSIIVIDLMLSGLITCSGCSPMPINGRPNVLLFHYRLRLSSCAYDIDTVGI
jgi:hypothetical protein